MILLTINMPLEINLFSILHFLQYTTQGSDTMFTCHHGPNECYGNKVHSCAIEHIQVRI